jgi:hypothetical protein
VNNARVAHAKQVRAFFDVVGGTKFLDTSIEVASHGMFLSFLKETFSVSALIGFLPNSNRHCN